MREVASLLVLVGVVFVQEAWASDFRDNLQRIEKRISQYGIQHGQTVEDTGDIADIDEVFYVVRSLSSNPARSLLDGQNPEKVHYALNGIAYAVSGGEGVVVTGMLRRFVTSKDKAYPQASLPFAAYYRQPLTDIMGWERLEDFIRWNDNKAEKPKSWIFTTSDSKTFESPRDNEITLIGMRIKNVVSKQGR